MYDSGYWGIGLSALLLPAVLALLCCSQRVSQAQSLPADPGQKELAKFRQNVRTEDAKLNALMDRIYLDCFAGRLREPSLPCLPYRFFAPGGGYPDCQTLWDTMFIANFYAPWGDADVLKGVFENYYYAIDHNPKAPKGSFRYGMVPCSLFKGRQEHFDFSQIPILAWGCLMVARQSGDQKLLEHSLPFLLAFDHWYSTERDVNEDGLIEVGAYALHPEAKAMGLDIVQCARYESFDYIPSLDSLKLTPHPKRKGSGAWYGNIDCVDMTCYLIMSERAIVEIATELGKTDLAKQYEATIARRVKAVQHLMWNPKTQFFHNIDRDSHKPIPEQTFQGFLPLVAGAATKEQAAALVKALQDPKRFGCKFPLPTQAMDDPKYSPRGVCRGDVWPPINYLVALGLNRYGYYDLARELTASTIKMVGTNNINERYDGTSGQPIGGVGLQMSCVVGLMVVQNVYGLQEDFRTIRVPPGVKGRKLTWGALELSYPSDESVSLRSKFSRPFRVIFPESIKLSQPRVTCDGQKLDDRQVTVLGNEIRFAAEALKDYQVEARGK